MISLIHLRCISRYIGQIKYESNLITSSTLICILFNCSIAVPPPKFEKKEEEKRERKRVKIPKKPLVPEKQEKFKFEKHTKDRCYPHCNKGHYYEYYYEYDEPNAVEVVRGTCLDVFSFVCFFVQSIEDFIP